MAVEKKFANVVPQTGNGQYYGSKLEVLDQNDPATIFNIIFNDSLQNQRQQQDQNYYNTMESNNEQGNNW